MPPPKNANDHPVSQDLVFQPKIQSGSWLLQLRFNQDLGPFSLRFNQDVGFSSLRFNQDLGVFSLTFNQDLGPFILTFNQDLGPFSLRSGANQMERSRSKLGSIHPHHNSPRQYSTQACSDSSSSSIKSASSTTTQQCSGFATQTPALR